MLIELSLATALFCCSPDDQDPWAPPPPVIFYSPYPAEEAAITVTYRCGGEWRAVEVAYTDGHAHIRKLTVNDIALERSEMAVINEHVSALEYVQGIHGECVGAAGEGDAITISVGSPPTPVPPQIDNGLAILLHRGRLETIVRDGRVVYSVARD